MAAVVLLLGGIAILFSNGSALNSDYLRAETEAQLSSWSGGRAEITGPVRLRFFPNLVLETDAVRIASTPNIPYLTTLEAKSMSIDFALSTLLRRQPVMQRITLTDLTAELAIDGPSETPPKQDTGAVSLADALRTAPVRRIAIVNGTINAKAPKAEETFSAVNIDTSVSLPVVSVTASGDVTWRGEAIRFALTGQAPDDKDAAAKTPFTLSVENRLVVAEAKGEAGFSGGLRATGALDLRVAELRPFARWLGLLIPDGNGLDTFMASGSFQMSGNRLSLDEGTVELDGNRGLGALTVDISKPRPVIEGTLAYSTLDLRPYETKAPKPTGKAKAAAKAEPAPASERLDFPLLHHLDFDLRLSTSDIVTTPLTLRQVALSAVMHAGKLTADFAILDLCGGQGNGRLFYDASVPEAEVRLTGNVSDLAAATCSKVASTASPLSANLDMTIDLTSKGRTETAIARHLTGKVRLNAAPGDLTLDLGAFRNRFSLDGWDTLTARSSTFRKLSAELIFRPGTIYSDDLLIEDGNSSYASEGTVDLVKKNLDIQVRITPLKASSPDAETSTAQQPTFIARITGPWLKPKIVANGQRAGVSEGAPATTSPSPTR